MPEPPPSTLGEQSPVRLCYVHCYRDPDYTRARCQIEALRTMPGVELQLAATRRRGLWRYGELIAELWRAHRRPRPDAYLLGFRGHELFWLIRLLAGRRPVILDALMSPGSSLREEAKAGAAGLLLAPLVCALERRVLLAADVVLTDTPHHAAHYHVAFGVPYASIVPIPVGAVECDAPAPIPGKSFRVLFYGSFLPLHGVDVILRAASLLRELDIDFVFVGGTRRAAKRLEARCRELGVTRYTHAPWMAFEDLIERVIPAADLCLGGPFGDTPQSRRVVTTKTTQCLALGRPTVVGALAGDVGFRDRDNCFVVPQDDPAALAEAIRWAFEHRQDLPALGERGRALYRQRFGPEAIAAGLQEALRRALNHPGPRAGREPRR